MSYVVVYLHLMITISAKKNPNRSRTVDVLVADEAAVARLPTGCTIPLASAKFI
jgi:hypothetical protein